MARKLTDVEFRERVGDRLEELFGSAFDADFPFTDALPLRAVVFPTSYALDEEQLAALAGAALAVGGHEAFLWYTEAGGGQWASDLREPADLRALWCEGFENVLFDADGVWACFQSQDFLSVIGASSPRFMIEFERRYPRLRSGELEWARLAGSSVDSASHREALCEFVRYVVGGDRHDVLAAAGCADPDEPRVA